MENFKNYAIRWIAICTIALCGATKSSLAANKFVYKSSSQQSDTLSTEQFITQLSNAAAKEINLSKLAKKKSKLSKVREYTIKAMDASILIYADLKPFADPRNVTLADSTTFVPDQLISALKKVSNANFERQYLSISIEDHNQIIALLEKGAMFGDTAIVSLANKYLVVFRNNLDEAKYLSKNLSTGKQVADKLPKKRMK